MTSTLFFPVVILSGVLCREVPAVSEAEWTYALSS